MNAGLPRRAVPLAAIGVLILAAVVVGLLAARGPDPHSVPTAEAVDARTMSPFCTGLTLAACPSSQAIELRATIAQMVAAGKTNQEIDDFLLGSYPRTVIGAPRNPLAWIVPAGAVVAGLAVVAVLLLRLPAPTGGEEPGDDVPDLPAGDSARLAEDLQRFARGRSE